MSELTKPVRGKCKTHGCGNKGKLFYSGLTPVCADCFAEGFLEQYGRYPKSQEYSDYAVRTRLTK